MTYGDIFEEFKTVTQISGDVIDDYRPCYQDYDVPCIPNAIVIWLKNHDKIIYIKSERRYLNDRIG